MSQLLQQNQPEGVPPLPLTGERTLPDVPEENYWFQRHLFVYQWIADQSRGKRVVDLACGEGYGADLIAAQAESVVGVDANPEAYEHARLRYRRRNLTFERDLIEQYQPERSFDQLVFLQTIEHIQDTGGALEHFKEIMTPGGTAFISTPNRLTLAPKGAEKSENPWHIREYTAAEYRELLAPHFSSVEILGVFHRGKLRVHELAIKSGWDRVHKALQITDPFYSLFTPSIKASDFCFKVAPLDRALDFVAICHS